MADLFTYGTLMDAEIMKQVTGQTLASEPATLKNYARSFVKNEVYPGICGKPMSTVEGRVYRNIKPNLLLVLDKFEGELYRREIVTIRLANGKRLPANCYVVRPECRSSLSGKAWSLAWFLEEGKKKFSQEYVGFNK